MTKYDIHEIFPDPEESMFKKNGIIKMGYLIRTALNDKGLYHIQFNVQDKEVLKDAQKHPEKYPTLMVRVAGYSVYFTDLGKPVQDNIIARTEHRM